MKRIFLRIIELENELKKKDEIIEKQRQKKIVYKREMERYRRKLTRIYDEFRSQITGEDSVLFEFLKNVWYNQFTMWSRNCGE